MIFVSLNMRNFRAIPEYVQKFGIDGPSYLRDILHNKIAIKIDNINNYEPNRHALPYPIKQIHTNIKAIVS